MERLTKRLPSGAADYNYPANCYFDDGSGPDRIAQSAFRQKCIERFAEYEDTYLTPELVQETAELAIWVHENGLDKIKEWIKADKDGRVVVLPCNVGDTVYVLYGKGYIPCVVDRFHILANKDVQARMRHFTIGTLWLSSSAFGKTVFLTREEAEKALEAMKDE